MYKDENEIFHHGIIGQKWYVRRYQNPDGTLTEAGKKRAAKLKGEYKQLTGKKLKNKAGKNDAHKEKNVHEMTDAELTYKINRIQKERTYESLMSTKTIKKEPVIKRAIKKTFNEVVTPSLISAGRTQLTNWLNTKGNEYMDSIKVKSKSQKLKEEAQNLENEWKIMNNRKKIEDARKGIYAKK